MDESESVMEEVVEPMGESLTEEVGESVQPVVEPTSEEDHQVYNHPLDIPVSRSMSMEAVSSAAGITPIGSPTADVSRAGRKRKANSRYMDEPSPVAKPVVRRKSVSTAPASPKNTAAPKRSQSSGGQVKKPAEPAAPEPVPVSGPPTFSSLLFGKKGSRKLSESLSDLDLNEESVDMADIASEMEDEDLHVEKPLLDQKPTKPVRKSSSVDETIGDKPSSQHPLPIIGSGEKMEGTYIASGAVGDTTHGMIKAVLVPPSGECSIPLPDMTTEEFQASVASFPVIPVELGGGGIFSLQPDAPVHWFRDEIPKLSAYFRKKMEATGGVVPKPAPTQTEKRAQALTAAQREERRRQKEEERQRLIEERNRRRERERLKQLYRQHWLALTKFPIEDDLLHSHKGIRRLGHPPAEARQVASPRVFWDCKLGPPGTLNVPLSTGSSSTELLDELFVVWSFFVHFGQLIGSDQHMMTLPDLVEAVMTKQLTSRMQSVFEQLLGFLRPHTEFQLTTLLQAEQALESQLTKNRGRAKLYWSSICQFRDFLFLGYSVLVNRVASVQDKGNTAWLWEALFVAKSAALLDSVDYKTKEFLPTIAAAFEEIDFEHRWIFDWELERGWTFEQMPFEYRVKLLKLLVDRIVALPVVKKSVDLWCDSRGHIAAEVAAIDKEERKLAQRVTLCQKLQAIMAQAEDPSAMGIQLPMTEQELAQEIALREALIRSRKTGISVNDLESAVRLEILGRDRHMNEYFQVSCDRGLVFVRQHSVSHPNVIRYGIYDSVANIDQLIGSLDERGVRELNLKVELQKVRTSGPAIDWLGSNGWAVATKPADELDEDADKFSQLKFLKECVDLTRNGFDRIRKAWTGKLAPQQEEEDDDTIDEDVMAQSPPEEDENMEEASSASSGERKPFVGEMDAFYDAVLTLADVLTECIRNSLIGFPKIDETTATTSSILIQFHIKTGAELLRHLSIPVDRTEFDRLVKSVDVTSKASMAQVAAVFLEGLEALDEVIHDEIARHSTAGASIEIWPANGGEKHAWRRFISSRADSAQAETASPAGEEEATPEEEEQEQEQPTSQTGGGFSCENCGKTFRFHILLGVHKLHPCKTRGRKPLSVDPVMEVLPVPANNGVLAIEKVTSVEFPPLPSTRQEAAERAEKAEKAAAAAAAAAAATEGEAAPTGQTEFVCDICGKVFPHNQGLAVHQTRWCIPEQQAQLLITAQQAVGGVPAPAPAPEEGPVNCPTCGKLFPTAQGLSIHQTRWCKGPEGSDIPAVEDDKSKVVLETSKHLVKVEPVFRVEPVPADNLVRIDEVIKPESEATEEVHREPGVTPACYSVAATSIAILWYANKIEAALRKFNSDKAHHSRSATHKAAPSKSRK